MKLWDSVQPPGPPRATWENMGTHPEDADATLFPVRKLFSAVCVVRVCVRVRVQACLYKRVGACIKCVLCVYIRMCVRMSIYKPVEAYGNVCVCACLYV